MIERHINVCFFTATSHLDLLCMLLDESPQYGIYVFYTLIE